ncbi:MAG TPA: sigma 54-interacting transcriptional regulator [Thermoanaerobacterales bacterium]|nr:sigma 54-interacting transcriptional regulator [Thermoanaerobacterales bacterium]
MTAAEQNNYKKLLDVILNFSSDGIFIADKNCNTIAYSETYRLYLGASKEQLKAMTIIDFYNEGWLSSVPLLEIIETKKPCSQIITYYKTGKEILATGTPVLDDNSQISYVVLSFRDISKLKEMEAELRASKKLLNQYRTELITLKSNKIFETSKIKYGLVYRSKSMNQLVELIETLARHDANVLILGETGVGKSLIAEIIHNLSERSNKGKFVKIDCSSIPENLLESELFGYKKGAFTGANVEGKVGLIELADKGTLFLDEIGEMPFNLQSKLLNVLEDKKVKRIGGTEYKPVDIRIISATNKNLEEQIRKNLFRRDLYYRLNVIPLTIPPLRERREDIIPLVKFYENFFLKKYDIKKEIPPNVYEQLLNYDWPGNVRELINIVERLLLLDPVLVLKDMEEQQETLNLPDEITGAENTKESLRDFMDRAEKYYLLETINSTRTLKECAEVLDVDISTVVRKMKKYNIRKSYK